LHHPQQFKETLPGVVKFGLAMRGFFWGSQDFLIPVTYLNRNPQYVQEVILRGIEFYSKGGGQEPLPGA
jgi:hypothetical protein